MNKILFFGLCLLGLFFTSCENDLLTNTESSNGKEITSRSKGGDGGSVNVENNGRWLVFSSEAAYRHAYDALLALDDAEKQETDVVVLLKGGKGDKGEYDTAYDPNTNLALWEQEVGHSSLRRSLALQEELDLRDGEDPGRIQRTLEDRNITDVITQTLFSEEGVIQVGSNIYYAVNPGRMIEVGNNRTELMESILDDGTDVIFEGTNHFDIKIRNNGSYRGVNDCTADFGSFTGVVDEENGTAQYTFLWNLGDVEGAEGLKLEWNFGDGETMTTTTPFVYHEFDGLQPNIDNSFTVCLTATYSYKDEEGNTVDCNNSSCETITISYEEETNDDPLFDCDDAQIVGSIIETIGLIDLLNITPTPGMAEQVCVNGTNLLLGSAELLDALNFNWSFQGQDGEGLQPCFIAPCDGTYAITLQITLEDGSSCMTLAEEYQHNVEANCEGKKDIQVKESFEYFIGGDRHKVCFRAKHQTKLDNNIFDWGKNQIETQQKSYKKRWYGWQKVSKRHIITLEGNVYPSGDACYCEGVPDYLDPSIDFRDKTEKNTKYYKQMFPSAEGIFCKVNDKYTVTFNENNGSVVQSYDFPQ